MKKYITTSLACLLLLSGSNALANSVDSETQVSVNSKAQSNILKTIATSNWGRGSNPRLHPLVQRFIENNTTFRELVFGTNSEDKVDQETSADKSTTDFTPLMIMDYFNNAKKSEINHYAKINSEKDFIKLIDFTYSELPQEVNFSSKQDFDTLNYWKRQYLQKITPSKLVNKGTLADYRLTKVGEYYRLADNNSEYTSKQIERGVKSFANDFSKSIQGNSDKEKFTSIYDFAYSNYKYNARGFRFMMVGNAHNGTMACNGLSRLVHELALSAGLQSEIIMSESHYYNHLIIDGKRIIVDVTTDIILENKHGATGLSFSEFSEYLSNVNFYSAAPFEHERETYKSVSLTKEEKEDLVDIEN